MYDETFDSGTERGQLPVVQSFAPFLDSTFKNFNDPPFSVRFWDGSVWSSSSANSSIFEFWLRNADALRALLNEADEVSLGEAYIAGDLYINGSLLDVLRSWPKLASLLQAGRYSFRSGWRPIAKRLSNSYSRFMQLGRRHSKPRDRAAAAVTFDQSPDFFRIFLGDTMLYSGGWFENESTELETAMAAKIQRVLGKLDLHAKQRFLDLGCGWGTLAIRAAQGFEVLSHGISLSREQIAFANDQIRKLELGSRCAVDQRDYRDLSIIHIPFDRAACLRTVEFVGQKRLRDFFGSVFDTVSVGSLVLIESMTRNTVKAFTGESFADRITFPDRDLPTVTGIENAATASGFETVESEDWTTHYRHTFQAWLLALERNEHEALRYADKRTVRGWKFYFAAIVAALESQELLAFQLLLRKPGI